MLRAKLIAALGLVLGSGCVASPDYTGTQFSCSEGVCPDGFDCIESVCIAEGSEIQADAAGDIDATLSDAALPDALPQVSCDELFSEAPGYELCSEDADSCSFNVNLAGETCAGACDQLGSTCLAAIDNSDPLCVPIPETGDTCDTARQSEICVCARIDPSSL